MMRRRADERGSTSVEYALLVGLIALVIIGVVAAFGGMVAQMFGHSSLIEIFVG